MRRKFDVSAAGVISELAFGFGFNVPITHRFDRQGTTGLAVSRTTRGMGWWRLSAKTRAPAVWQFLNFATGAWGARNTASNSPNFINPNPFKAGKNVMKFAIYDGRVFAPA